MDTQMVQYAAGLQVISFADAYGRETEICIGHKDIMVSHKTQDGNTESMRRYSKQEIEMLFDALGNML